MGTIRHDAVLGIIECHSGICECLACIINDHPAVGYLLGRIGLLTQLCHFAYPVQIVSFSPAWADEFGGNVD